MHYAKVNNGIVEQVIVADEEFINVFVDDSPGEWIQTSFNTFGGEHSEGGVPLRKNYAGVGYTYDPIRDAFISPSSYPSWSLNDASCLWEPPTPYPSDEFNYSWNEETTSWFIIEGSM
jgi:hypothetical protein